MKFKTDLILKILAIANLLMIPIVIWSLWQFIEMAIDGKAYSFLINLLIHGIGFEVLISFITAWAFFKGWKWLLLLYIPYSLYTLPDLIVLILDYRTHPQFDSPFYFPSILYTWLQAGLLLAILLTALFFLFETYHSKKNLIY